MLWEKGITGLPLARLNARLASYVYVIDASKGQDANHLAMCTGEYACVEQFRLFELRGMSPTSPGDMNS